MDKARERAKRARLDQVRFEVGGVADFDIVESVDAIVGRLILLHLPESQLCAQGMRWIFETFRRAGVETDMGSKLFSTFRRAGLPEPQMLLSGRFEGGPDSFAYRYLTDVLKTLLPLAERFGIDTFAERLRDDVVALDGVLQPPAFVGAWARVAS
ncbi:hypothetical protein AWB83_06935 [Caballeronia ptereochthonis]|uniref:Uncharacterized protein n=2 Tax=Caballeronia ptereochthonis TaxID=1777144 RepID=A0A158EAU5_9BURK|nr:hypothetical protein AWB83_06935 [Caballeronia ptereochthonis]